MDFIEIKDGNICIDDSEWDEEPLIDRFCTLIKKWRFDSLNVSTGVWSSPDFGYFDLADRFWRASLCIYFLGTSQGFWERGIGYAEPWLFNVRHSIELYLKGFLLYVIWFEELQHNHLSSGYKTQIDNLKTKHELADLYEKCNDNLKSLVSGWNTEKLSNPPQLDKMLLTAQGEDILKEIIEADKKGFRFRYPSLVGRKTKAMNSNIDRKKHCLQRADWKHDNKELLPITGLPKKAGYFFDHVKVINALHILIKEMKSIASYYDASWAFIGNLQDIELDLMEYYSE